ncbi:hypothetical protein [Xenorhabdus bovienii]|uniref:hypothetical protein n=1 Tax=Xenorhabdus bovienii TaxID=40576 RepID=UPI0004D607B8|nr:hypothetical protein [Xenorhabdus bovienii]CDG89062.1 conserved hypothetical protein [Xenorhabdus bovienii str. feltiae France]CDG93468.1 conserved hypothetical protein [Xenorhabdus bovienii str. feltiae Florida]
MKSNYLVWFHRPAWQLFLLQQLLVIPLILSFYFWVWQENEYAIHDLQLNITEQKHSSTLSEKRIAELPNLSDIQQQIQQLTAELSQGSNILHNNIPQKNATVLKRLHQPLTSSGSQLMEWKSYRKGNQIFWHIMLSLSYDQFLHFLNEIQQVQPILLIKHLTIIPVDSDLTVRMVLSDALHEG